MNLSDVTSERAPDAGRRIRLLTEAFHQPPALDTAISRAVLTHVSSGDEPETLRLYRPGPVVAFGPQDVADPRFAQAAAAARRGGFASVLRLAGGRAAVFHEDTIAFSWALPDPAPRARIRERFEETAEIIAEALRQVGITARVGEVPGEYCPGEFSVNARGRKKLMGVGQRLMARAAHVGGVIVVGGADRIRDILLPVYEALGIPWDPSTVGSIEDELGVASYDAVMAAVRDVFAARYELVPEAVAPGTLALAAELAPEHEA